MSEVIIDVNTKLDQFNMKSAIAGFPDQINQSFSIMENWVNRNKYTDIHTILVLGMGGSAIGGDVARVISQDSCTIPIIVNRSYNIPNWVDSNTLILASSYSGGTEETLSAFKHCRVRNCPIIVFSTGGKITEYAEQYGLDRIMIPSGYQPRAALGFSFTLILLLLNRTGFIDDKTISLVQGSIDPLNDLSCELSLRKNAAIKVADEIYTTCPIIYGSEDLTWVVALRFRSQLAENAKMLSFHHHFPEQNHNEIEGWTSNPDIMERMSIIWLKDQDDHPATQSRMDISSELLDSCTGIQLTIVQKGSNRVERLLKLIHYTDWISYYAALLNDVDPTPVNKIQELKIKISKSS